MNRIKKFNESVLGDDTINLQITRSEYNILKEILGMYREDLMDKGSWRANLHISGIVSEKDSAEIRKYLSQEGSEEAKRYLYLERFKKITDINYLDYMIIRIDEEFENNNI